MRIVTAEQIRAEIKEYGVSKFAREIGVTRTYLSRVVNGRRHLSKRVLALLRYQAVYQDLTTYQNTTPTPKQSS